VTRRVMWGQAALSVRSGGGWQCRRVTVRRGGASRGTLRCVSAAGDEVRACACAGDVCTPWVGSGSAVPLESLALLTHSVPPSRGAAQRRLGDAAGEDICGTGVQGDERWRGAWWQPGEPRVVVVGGGCVLVVEKRLLCNPTYP